MRGEGLIDSAHFEDMRLELVKQTDKIVEAINGDLGLTQVAADGFGQMRDAVADRLCECIVEQTDRLTEAISEAAATIARAAGRP